MASFYILDFSLNAIQAALRALVLDLVPSDQQTVANAYLARMTSIGNIVGYSFGYINLTSSRALHWIGGGQFRKLCVLAVTVLNVSVFLTCMFNPEEKLPKKKRNKSYVILCSGAEQLLKDFAGSRHYSAISSTPPRTCRFPSEDCASYSFSPGQAGSR